MSEDFLQKALVAKRESKSVEFKSDFDPSRADEWCELVKDLVAIANSGGGIILFGVDGSGNPIGCDVNPILELDQAVVSDKLRRYTTRDIFDFEIVECSRKGEKLAALTVNGAAVPLVFEQPGTYEVSPGKQKTAFARGTVYFRHGAKSEPGTSDDLRRSIERQLEVVRKQWVQGVRRVMSAPAGSRVAVLPGDVVESKAAGATPIRIVNDPSAPAFRRIDPDETHPYRQKELLVQVNRRFPDGVALNSHDLLAVRRVHSIDAQSDLCHHPKFGSPQYSPEFVEWLIEHHRENPQFFEEARVAYRNLAHDG